MRDASRVAYAPPSRTRDRHADVFLSDQCAALFSGDAAVSARAHPSRRHAVDERILSSIEPHPHARPDPLYRRNTCRYSAGPRVTAIPYSPEYASLYDVFYRDKPYDTEVSFLVEQLESYGIRPGARLLELACGTGEHAIRLARRGYQVLATDFSA